MPTRLSSPKSSRFALLGKVTSFSNGPVIELFFLISDAAPSDCSRGSVKKCSTKDNKRRQKDRQRKNKRKKKTPWTREKMKKKMKKKYFLDFFVTFFVCRLLPPSTEKSLFRTYLAVPYLRFCLYFLNKFGGQIKQEHTSTRTYVFCCTLYKI